MRWKNRVLGVTLVVLAAATASLAADAESSKWQFDVFPYGWLVGNFGTVTVKGNTVHSNVTPSDVYGLLEDGKAFASAGYFGASYDRFSVFVDSMGGYLSESVDEQIPTPLCCSISVRARARIKLAITDVGFGYQVGQWSLPARKRPITLGLYTGTRFMWFTTTLNANVGVAGGVQRAANVSDTFSWADPLIGVRWSVPLLDPVSLDFRGDIGGFHASSDLIWGITSTVKVWLPWHPLSLEPYASMGYRAINFDRSPSSKGNINLDLRGPLAGAGFAF